MILEFLPVADGREDIRFSILAPKGLCDYLKHTYFTTLIIYVSVSETIGIADYSNMTLLLYCLLVHSRNILNDRSTLQQKASVNSSHTRTRWALCIESSSCSTSSKLSYHDPYPVLTELLYRKTCLKSNLKISNIVLLPTPSLRAVSGRVSLSHSAWLCLTKWWF